jgi:tubulin-specific chaperone D
MLLWLSHLLLAPFDLASISSELSSGIIGISTLGLHLPVGLPSITKRLLPISLRYLAAPGKERESAKLLLVRLTLRRDMRQLGLLHSLIGWALYNLAPHSNRTLSMPIYQHVGVLSFLAGLLASTDRGTIGEFILPIFRAVQSIADKADPLFVEIRSSALARKFMIKIFRLLVTLVLKPKPNPQDPISEAVSSTILEDVVDKMLTAVADKDTPIRYAASKALSVIAAQLEGDMAAEVVEAVVESLGEDVLWENDFPEPGIEAISGAAGEPHHTALRRNLTATNPLRWHGLTLTLAHLLFHRSPPPKQLPQILNSLILALGYEQRSATGSSLGTNVRDAACFGIWALSRRYSTKELLEVDIAAIGASRGRIGHMSVPQLLATELVVSASLDPSGNIRRGSSAALQELIGRHPDTVTEGIKVVQVVDYHAVARRSRAITEVAVGAAELAQIYWRALFSGMLDWRGTGSPDAESRRVSAYGVGCLLTTLAKVTSIFEAADIMIKQTFKGLAKLRSREVEERHGLLLALSEIVNTAGRLLRDSTKTQQELEAQRFTQKGDIFGIWEVFGTISPLSAKDLISSTVRPELTAEAACNLISSLMRQSRSQHDNDQRQTARYLFQEVPEAFMGKCVDIISLAIQRSEENVVLSASLAAKDVFRVLDNTKRKELLQSWVMTLNSDINNALGSTGKSFGHLAAIGAVFPYFSTVPIHQCPQLTNKQLSIIRTLTLHASAKAQIESRVVAIKSLATGVLGSKG